MGTISTEHHLVSNRYALAEVYKDILLVASEVCHICLRKGVPRPQWSIAICGFKLRDTRFERVVQDLERRRRVLEEEIIFEDRRLNHADRVERQLLAVLPIEDQHLKYDSFLSTLSPCDNKKNWLLRREEFTNWGYKTHNGILCLYGKPGTGKSVVASVVIKWAKTIFTRPGLTRVVAYFFCEPVIVRTAGTNWFLAVFSGLEYRRDHNYGPLQV